MECRRRSKKSITRRLTPWSRYSKPSKRLARLLCQVGGNWCPWCLRFAEFAVNDDVVAPLIKENYVYIHVNYSKDNKNLEAMKYLGNPGRFGYPVFVILDQEGRPIHIQESESLEEGKGYNQKKVEKFLRLWNKKAVEAEVK